MSESLQNQSSLPLPSSAPSLPVDVAQATAHHHASPRIIAGEHTQIAKTNPPQRIAAHHGAPPGLVAVRLAHSTDPVAGDVDASPRTMAHHDAPLTHPQRIAARLTVAGIGSLEVAAKLKIGRATIARWKRDPRFIAELERLTIMVDRALVQHLLPSVAARVREPLMDPMADPPRMPLKKLPAELPKPGGATLTFTEMVIHLGHYGIHPKTHPKEFRDAMRRAGIYK